ncbi:hypothetical protein, conserved [Eimeria maxima]|uniref:Uncharacterized protein n=1 Tax=Eimeria maxima TaxID=5804 RepID=U6MC38_EIMMA|nr:hypothetical protein, conserved [Eimeria maxima]CDJ61576.1 hypothetical protein, conserved [Eimeria maxima]
MELTAKEKATELEACIRETQRKVEALVNSDAGDINSTEILQRIEANQAEVHQLKVSGEIPEAILAQQERILSRAAELLASHCQRKSLSRPFSFKRSATAASAETAGTTAVCRDSHDAATGFAAGADGTAKEAKLTQTTKETDAPTNVLHISDISNRVVLVPPGVAGGREVWMKNLDGCTVYILDGVPGGRLQDLCNCAVL